MCYVGLRLWSQNRFIVELGGDDNFFKNTFDIHNCKQTEENPDNEEGGSVIRIDILGVHVKLVRIGKSNFIFLLVEVRIESLHKRSPQSNVIEKEDIPSVKVVPE